jgi:molybdate transport system ATP-binding protein
VLLLDEPLSALDLATRRALRGELRRILTGLPCATIYVTHAPLEATAFGDAILVLEEGRASQSGSRDELLRHPKSAYVAEFMGMNLFHGEITYRDFAGLAEVQAEDRTLSVVDPGGDDEVFVAVGPRDVTLHLEAPAGSAQNVFFGPIEEIVPEPPFGERLRVALATEPPLVAEITRHSAELLGLAPGKSVYASFKASAVTTYR